MIASSTSRFLRSSRQPCERALGCRVKGPSTATPLGSRYTTAEALAAWGRTSDRSGSNGWDARGDHCLWGRALAASTCLVAMTTVAGGNAACSSDAPPPAEVPKRDAPSRHLGPTESEFVVRAQRHLLRPTTHNPVPTMMPPPSPCLSAHHFQRRYVICIVGLPLRGKAHTARRLQRYLEFFHGAYIELFDISEYANDPDANETIMNRLTSFFQAADLKPQESQDNFATAGTAHVTAGTAGRIAILFASDVAQSRKSIWGGLSKRARHTMKDKLEEDLQARLVCVEIALDDSNSKQKEYLSSLCSMRGITEDEMHEIIRDFKFDFTTIQEDGSEDDLMFMKLLNFNSRIVANNMMRSFVGSRIAQFLASVHPYRRTIYITRHGESMYNKEKKLGGDSSLSSAGIEYAKRLAEFADIVISRQARDFAVVDVCPADVESVLQQLLEVDRPQDGLHGIFARAGWETVKEGMQLLRVQCGQGDGSLFQDAPASLQELQSMFSNGDVALVFAGPMPDDGMRPSRLWTSSLRRTKETAQFIAHPTIDMGDGKSWEQFSHRVRRNLDEVYAGEYEGLTYDDIKKRMPAEAELRKLDKLGYRYPRGESYYDIIARLDDPIQHLESTLDPCLIISHQATLRLVYAFLAGIPRKDAPELSIPLHSVIMLELDGTGAFPKERRFFLGPKAVKDDGQKLI